MGFSSYIGFRYLRGRPGLFSLGTLISIGGVAVGVWALIVVISVMTGFNQEMKRKILGTRAHLLVQRSGGGIEQWEGYSEKLKGFDGVQAVAPFVYGQAMMSSRTNVMGVQLFGVDPRSIVEVNELAEHLREGSIADLTVPEEDSPAIIIGQELAVLLGVIRGDRVNIISPLGNLTPFGMVPRMQEFQVVGIFQSGMYEYDSSYVFMDLGEAQRFFDIDGKITGFSIRVKQIEEADTVAARISSALGYPFYTRDWKEMNRNLFAALRLEKIVMFLILTLIVLVASFNIVAHLVMVVAEKRREIGILRAMGATARSIMSIFVFQGVVIGLIGTLIGLGTGIASCWIVKRYKIIELPADIYYITTIPAEVRPLEVLLVCCIALFISFLATLYPSYRAARKDPVEAIRYE